MKPLMLDLFSGTGGASDPFAAKGWEVVRVELDESFPAEFHADIREFSWTGRRPTLIWASPPCTEFARESMPWSRTGKTPSLDMFDATDRIIRECQPDHWIIENVRGATKHLRSRYGRPLCLGPVRLWGDFPPFWVRVHPWKERLGSKQKAARARMPYQIGEGLLRAIEGSLFWVR